MKYVWLLLAFVMSTTGLAFGVTTIKAADTDWHITRFHSDIAVQPDGTAKITELIGVNFAASKHGIYRDIPYQYNSNGSTVYTNLQIFSVQQDGKDTQYNQTNHNGYTEVKIGDPNKTISGDHQYQIIYTAAGVLQSFKDYDELYWNVTGNLWPVQIDQASATVTIPHQKILQTSCYQGKEDSTDKCQSVSIGSLESRFVATRPLKSGEGLTVAVGFTKGIVPILAVAKPQTTLDELMSAAQKPQWWGIGLISLLVGLAVPIGLWWRRGRDWRWAQPGMLAENQVASTTSGKLPVVVEFTPPANLRPAELALLLHQKVKTLDISSTIIDLASRGYLKITEMPKSWIFGSKDYQLDRTEVPSGGLLDYEQLLLARLFGSKKSIKLSSLKDTFYNDLADVQAKVYQDLVERKLFVANPKTVRNLYLGVGAALAIIAGGLTLWTLIQGIVWPVFVLIGPLVAGIGLMLFSSAMPQRTAAGADLQRRAKGYELFISTAEKYRQQFFEKENLFTEVLPYAMAFGLTHKFANAMQVIGYQPAQPNWYVGQSAFNAVAFGSDMQQMSGAFSSVMTSAPSSSGSGGGGFSGGGFGGGGGGSW